MARIFPSDCLSTCQHFETWELGVDDSVYVCHLLNTQVDSCDVEDGSALLPVCPLSKGEYSATRRKIFNGDE